jgi:hypothetical protein
MDIQGRSRIPIRRITWVPLLTKNALVFQLVLNNALVLLLFGSNIALVNRALTSGLHDVWWPTQLSQTCMRLYRM